MTLLNGRSTTESLDRQITTEPGSEGAVAESLNGREKAQLSPGQSWKAMEDSPPSQVQRPRSSLERWFTNLPVGRKQFLALLICELVPLVGLGLGAGWIVTQSSRQQLTTLAKAEAEVTNIAYNLKVNQMGLGSRGQADNLAIVNAAVDYQQGISLSPAAGDRIRKILKNEVQARRMEYATLVSNDLTIIANANRDRQGEFFDPHSLISIALDQKRQVKASELTSWSELQQEGAVLPDGLSEQDILIRYVVTPVFDPLDETQTVGVLLFGDIVNGKSDIPQKVLRAFEQGYSAVYQRDDSGNFSVASSLQVTGDEGIDGGSYNLGLDAEAFLEQAAANPQETFTQRMMVGGQPYTLAVQSQPSRVYSNPLRGDIPVYDNAPHALLIHGTPEKELGQLVRKGLIEGAIVTLACLILLILWNRLFRRTLLKPLLSLESATEAFAQGDRQQRAEIYGVDEVGQLAMAFNGMADSIIESEQFLADEAKRQTEQAQRARQLSNITVAMRETADEANIFQAAVDGIRQMLGADRAVIYRFNAQYEGTITAESVLPGWAAICGQDVADPCFAEQYVESYQQGRVHVVSNIETANLQDCYRQELDPFEVKANLVVPILVDEQLLALLCIHQCSGPRDWQDDDISLAQQVATQLGYALEQAQLIRAQEQARRDAEVASDVERKRNEALQMQLIELLSDVENVADGDLTIRANVSEGAIGTVADFFNSIVESLRQVVTQVKDSATQVNRSVDDSNGEIRQLAHEALRQSEEIDTALNSVESMTRSIQAVATSARETASVSQTAAETAVAGGVSMDRTVENILTLRETIGETAKKVKRLGESSQQISKVVYLINQIAMQTNLLAINAGIEAARAGEQGQGFAVVAEEVGELAARSASATKEIEQIVETIQRETGEVVQAMELGTTQVVEGTHLVEDAKQNLNQIVSVSRQIDQLVQSISDATVSQADTSQSITELMQKLSAIAQRTSSASTEVSESLQDTLGVTEQLQQSVGTFKVT